MAGVDHQQDGITGTPDLRVALESPLPATLEVGRATAVFCSGSCFHRREDISELQLIVDGRSQSTAALGMPRPDVRRAVRALSQREFEPDLARRSYRSGFWATLPVPAHDRPGAVVLQACAQGVSGTRWTLPLGHIDVVERAPPPSWPSAQATEPGAGLIAICLATFDPNVALLRVQIESLRAQTDRRWICLISDDCSSPGAWGQINDVVGNDPRFVLSRSEQRRGFYRNFERALRMVPPEVELVALCDHDDRWYPRKLAVLRAALGGAGLVYSDQRLVDDRGRVLRDTLWRGRRNNHTNLASLLVANTITGAAMLMRREVVELALPFPDTPGLQFHDHWLGLVALASGDVRYVDCPLYDYVQHPGAVFGEVTSASSTGPRPRRRRLDPRPRRRSGRWRAAYFCGYLAREVQAQALLVRCSERLTPRKRRTLQRFVDSAHSPSAWGWLLARSLRAVIGRNETLGGEIGLAQGILWRWFVGLRVRSRSSALGGNLDASFPDPMAFEQRRLRRWRARL